jgi:precorrin-4 methylase
MTYERHRRRTVPAWYSTGPAGPELLVRSAEQLLKRARDVLYNSHMHGTEVMAASTHQAAMSANTAAATIRGLTVQGALIAARQGL